VPGLDLDHRPAEPRLLGDHADDAALTDQRRRSLPRSLDADDDLAAMTEQHRELALRNRRRAGHLDK